MIGEHAVVCGASMAGLLAATALSESYRTVTLVERDVLPEEPAQRRGVSQGRHLHTMLCAGLQRLEDLLPGVIGDLEEAGAIVLEGPDDPSLFRFSMGDRVFSQSGRFTRSADMTIVLASRPLMEAVVRRRVRQIDNIAVLDDHDAVEPVLAPSGRVTGVRVVDRRTHADTTLVADVVVDATGRGARTPAFLEKHGYSRPPERRYAIDIAYSSQFFSVAPHSFRELVAMKGATLDNPSGAGMLAYEDGTVVVTLLGYAGHRVPTDSADFLAAAGDSLPTEIVDTLRTSEPIGEISVQRYPVSVWRRYDKLTRFPQGYLVIGDAVCGFNPVFGQGMTSAAVQADVLRQSLNHGADQLSERFFRDCAKRLAPMWWANRAADFTIMPTQTWVGSRIKKVVNAGMDTVWAAAATDISVAESIIRQIHLLDPPATLITPTMLRRLVAARRVDARS